MSEKAVVIVVKNTYTLSSFKKMMNIQFFMKHEHFILYSELLKEEKASHHEEKHEKTFEELMEMSIKKDIFLKKSFKSSPITLFHIFLSNFQV